MATNKITPEELWARQQISPLEDVYKRQAQLLGIDRKTLYNKLKLYGIEL